MKTIAIGIQNLCVPCECACKYCLLQSCKQQSGVDYNRGKKIAERIIDWGRENNIHPLPYYYIGYSVDHPELLETIARLKASNFVGADFLQCNGIKMRSEAETKKFVSDIFSAGIKSIDTTFYGNKKYHDEFAARIGDFDFMILLAKCAIEAGLNCMPSIPITEENKDMLDELIQLLSGMKGIHRIGSFLPDYRGRGYLLEPVRLTDHSLKKLSQKVLATLNMTRYKTEQDWLSIEPLPEYTQRSLCISLRDDNIDMFEQMSCNEIISYVENLDNEYYSAIPTINELASIYGDKDNVKLYRLRDLFWKWQKQYIQDNHIDIYDVTNEIFCNTVRS